jgi:hypothetical protein
MFAIEHLQRDNKADLLQPAVKFEDGSWGDSSLQRTTRVTSSIAKSVEKCANSLAFRTTRNDGRKKPHWHGLCIISKLQ